MSTPSIQPLHQAQDTGANLRRSMFKKPEVRPLRDKFASPTDDMLSPCSQKLNDHKSKLFTAKAKPTKLNFATEQKQEDSDDDY
ncbi:Spo12 superfamily protein [Lachancea thermotolerans]